MMNPKDVRDAIDTISCSLFNTAFSIRVKEDELYVNQDGSGRMFLQAAYFSLCNKTGISKWWYGRKWYLSAYMTKDEVIKTAYVAYKTAVEHEIMETFKVNGVPLFNPHTSHERLLEVSLDEVKRQEM